VVWHLGVSVRETSCFGTQRESLRTMTRGHCAVAVGSVGQSSGRIKSVGEEVESQSASKSWGSFISSHVHFMTCKILPLNL
jgi:hypothetical protein